VSDLTFDRNRDALGLVRHARTIPSGKVRCQIVDARNKTGSIRLRMRRSVGGMNVVARG
jgi:hypothetical protein